MRGFWVSRCKVTKLVSDHVNDVKWYLYHLFIKINVVPVIPGAEVTSIPADGNLGEFSVEQMVTMFRHLRLPEELVYRLNKCKVDGKRFSVFTDTELSDLGMNNPIIRYFRDRTAQKHKKKPAKFML